MSFWVSCSTPTRLAFACTALNLAFGSCLTGAPRRVPSLPSLNARAQGAALGRRQAAPWDLDRRDCQCDQAPVAAVHSSEAGRSLAARSSSAGKSQAARRPPDRHNSAAHRPQVRNSGGAAGRNRPQAAPSCCQGWRRYRIRRARRPRRTLVQPVPEASATARQLRLPPPWTAVLKTLSIGDPSTRPFDETLRGGPPYGET